MRNILIFIMDLLSALFNRENKPQQVKKEDVLSEARYIIEYLKQFNLDDLKISPTEDNQPAIQHFKEEYHRLMILANNYSISIVDELGVNENQMQVFSLISIM